MRELRLLRCPPDLPNLGRRQPSFPAPRVPDLDPVPTVEHLAAEHAQALAALVPQPRRPLLADHGVVAPHASWRAAIVPGPAQEERPPAPPERRRAPGRLTWPTRLRRVCAFAGLVCPRGGGPRRILGAVTEPHAVRRRLGALGLAAKPPPRGPVSAA